MMEVDAGVMYAEAPVGAGLSFVALHFEGLGCSVEGLHVGEALVRQLREKTLNWISAVFNRLPCLGV